MDKAAVDTFAASGAGKLDCILMDLMMPVMSGYEATRVIRALKRADAASVPIIALSANTFEEDIALAKDAGMNEHLAKPVDMRNLFETMSRAAALTGPAHAKSVHSILTASGNFSTGTSQQESAIWAAPSFF